MAGKIMTDLIIIVVLIVAVTSCTISESRDRERQHEFDVAHGLACKNWDDEAVKC
jgi:hypothetical protein